MCNPKEKLILDSYVEGTFVTENLVGLLEENSKPINYEIYRGLSVPKFMLEVGNDINKYYDNDVMSFTKELRVAKRFSEKPSVRNFPITDAMIKELAEKNCLYDDSLKYVNVIIRVRNIKSLDMYGDFHYENKCYEREKEVLLVKRPLYIKSITVENGITFLDCTENPNYLAILSNIENSDYYQTLACMGNVNYYQAVL